MDADKSEKSTSLVLMPDGTMREAAASKRRTRKRTGSSDLSEASKARLRNVKPAWFLIDPQSRHVALWDSLTALTLIYIAIFAPLEVAFMDAVSEPLSFLFLQGRVVDAIFIADLALQFCIKIPSADEPGKLETRWQVIAFHYLTGWFPVDFLCLSSSLFDLIPFVMGDGGKKNGLGALRVLRVLRLAKLIRLVKASQRLKEFYVKIATPRAMLTIMTSLVECAFFTHWAACFLSLMAVLQENQLDTWMATHGFCVPLLNDDGLATREYTCTPASYLYFQCVWWAAGMLMGAPISMTPHQGPFPRHFSRSAGPGDHMVLLTVPEQGVVLVLKILTAFEWITVIARFVQVYNNLSPDTRDFRIGWDALNSFVSYFKVGKADALELRRYYIERASLAKAKTRKRVMDDFSPYLCEKYVWMLNKDWLMKVPCFSLVVERLFARPGSGMEKFLIAVAVAMRPAVYVPSELTAPQRLYIITDGAASLKSRKMGRGDSWGAEDILLRSALARKDHIGSRALAETYLHVLYVGAETFADLADQHHEAYMLTKLWATIFSAGRALVDMRKRQKEQIKPVVVGGNDPATSITPDEVEHRINEGLVAVVKLTGDDGRQLCNGKGQLLYTFKFRSLALGEYEIIKEHGGRSQLGELGSKFRVEPRSMHGQQLTSGSSIKMALVARREISALTAKFHADLQAVLAQAARSSPVGMADDDSLVA